MQSNQTYFSSPLGEMKIQATTHGISLLEFIDQKNEPDEGKLPLLKTELLHKYIVLAISELDQYFHGQLKSFTVPIDLVGTDFQVTVWNNLLQIPYSETRTYEQQSELLQNRKAIRAVASANGQNPIAIIVPCHRVIGKNGSLTGYAGGLERKKYLLNLEKKYSGKPVQTELEF